LTTAAANSRGRVGFGGFIAPLIYGVATVVALYPVAELEVASAAAVAATLGAVSGALLSRTRLRTLTMAALSLLGVLACLGLHAAMLGSAALAHALGPSTALLAANLCGAGLASGFFALGLRALASRRRLFSLLEVVLVGLSFAQLVIAHRFGAINRPFALADSIIAAGGDPTAALLMIGALTAVLVITLLLDERSLLRSLLHLSLALLLLSLVLTSTRMLGLPSPPAGATGLGLRPDDKPSNQEKHPQGGHRPRDGQSDNERLDFRDNYDSQGRQVPLAVVLLHDDYSPPTGMYYFRQTAFSQYNGKRMVAATRAGVDGDVAPAFVSQKTQLAKVPNATGDRVELETTVALLAEHTRPFALESAESIEPLGNPDASRFRRVYRVQSAALSTSPQSLLGREVGDPSWSPEILAHYTTAPSDPRYAKLAQEIVASIHENLRDDKVARALAVSVWLSREGTYSLRSGHSQADDPTADFLFGDRTGYCVHFAHAAVYLMRALGIAARVGAGYVVDEAARQGGSSILITGANSHAWPEFYVDGVGWVVDDVSPAHSLDPPPPPPDPDLQHLLGEMARGLKPLPQSADRPLEPLLHAAARLRDALARASLFVLVVGTLVLYGVKLWRWLAPAFARSALPRVAYRAELDRLSQVSLRRQYGETRESFAARVAQTAPSFAPLTDRHLAAAFGERAEIDHQELHTLRRAVACELRGRVSWWRRGLGALTPWSWLLSR
jgi:transglutaminase-like putative cysteine protease